MAEKLSGIEMMLNSLMRAAGFDPKEVVGQMTTVVKAMQDGLSSVDNRLNMVMEAQKIILANQAAMQRDMHIIKCALGINDPKPLLINGAHAPEEGDQINDPS